MRVFIDGTFAQRYYSALEDLSFLWRSFSYTSLKSKIQIVVYNVNDTARPIDITELNRRALAPPKLNV